ncbi:PaaI family thioesterase [Chachezhania antarctica]|uniref:PaaI family thioesterase n=1 Tax=Chachezhania antarctica TaxID=2340860 RepID=UPI000EAC02D8|nr:PaaI family thioesterase [Chachezhania antarctica]
MTDGLDFGKTILDRQPFNRFVGFTLTRLDEGGAEMRLEVGDDHKQERGFVHGGVMAAMADTTLTYAAGVQMGPVLTSEFKINYVRPGIGDRLIARAEVVAKGRTQAVCQCRIFVENEGAEKLCAIAQGTIVAVPA